MSYCKILYGENEFYKGINNKKYYIYVINNIDNEKIMNTLFTDFITNQNNNPSEKHYIGIDCEFNKISKGDRIIGLMQINIENDSNDGHIFLLQPPSLSDNSKLLQLFTQPKMIKILHGSESLDIPYLFNQLLITENNINNFCKHFYDTKIICEYNNNKNKNKNIDINKCSIYDLLIDSKIMTKEQLEKFDKMEDRMGPIYLIHVDVNNLSSDFLDYALYDVIYLPELIKKLVKTDKKYKLITSELFTIINIYKRNINTYLHDIEILINTMNTYYIYDNTILYNFHNIWNIYYDVMFNKIKITHLTNINYFKLFFKIISKFILYSNVLKYYKTFSAKNNIVNIILDISKLDWLKQYKYIYNIIIDINYHINMDIKLITLFKD